MKILTLTSVLAFIIILFSDVTSVKAQSAPPAEGYAEQKNEGVPQITSKDRQKFRNVRKEINKLNQKFDKKLKDVNPKDQSKVREVYTKHQEKIKEKVKSSGLSVKKYNHLVHQQGPSPKNMGQ